MSTPPNPNAAPIPEGGGESRAPRPESERTELPRTELPPRTDLTKRPAASDAPPATTLDLPALSPDSAPEPGPAPSAFPAGPVSAPTPTVVSPSPFAPPSGPPTAAGPAPAGFGAPAAPGAQAPAGFGAPTGPGAPGGYAYPGQAPGQAPAGGPYGGPPPGGPGFPGAPGAPWGGPPPAGTPFAYPPMAQPPKSNGLALAALIVGIIGLLLALTPFVFMIGAVLALVALGLGIAAIVQAGKGAPRKAMAIVGTVLGGVGLVGTIGGMLLTGLVVGTSDKWSVGQTERSDVYGDGSEDGSTDEYGDDSESDSAEVTALKIGEAMSYDNGVSVTLSDLKRFETERNPYDKNPPEDTVRVTVVVKNDSKTAVKLDSALAQARDDKGEEAPRFYYDPDAPFKGTLLPGKSATATYCFGVKKSATSLQIELTPEIVEYEDGIWDGPIG
ncbi:DUF4352 domain-containing protein [Streptomyces sp. BI20]|uniref:DUF4190 domain-containing protein n=1 Tax=Streptomyces sp. BI20 TaxID=3403460 RepID=UPI003C77490F